MLAKWSFSKMNHMSPKSNFDNESPGLTFQTERHSINSTDYFFYESISLTPHQHTVQFSFYYLSYTLASFLDSKHNLSPVSSEDMAIQTNVLFFTFNYSLKIIELMESTQTKATLLQTDPHA